MKPFRQSSAQIFPEQYSALSSFFFSRKFVYNIKFHRTTKKSLKMIAFVITDYEITPLLFYRLSHTWCSATIADYVHDRRSIRWQFHFVFKALLGENIHQV